MSFLKNLFGQRAAKGFRVYYTGDIHGSELCFRKLLKAPEFYNVDAVIVGGDITGKALLPVVEQADGSFAARIQGSDRLIQADELEKLEESIRFNGFYPYRCTPAEHSRLDADEAFRKSTFTGVMVAQIERWCALAAERRRDGLPMFIMPGNDDEFAIDQAIGGDGVVNPEGQLIELGSLQMVSCCWTNPTPWHSPREENETALGVRLERMAGALTPGRPTILNLHCPPFDSSLDSAPKLTDDLRPVMAGGQPVIGPVGSKAVRAVIERLQPVLTLHGHIHESRGIAKIGRTTCVNPGSQYSEGRLDGAVIELSGDEIVSCQLVSG
jgi:Icc-related predicted phosphoesterase